MAVIKNSEGKFVVERLVKTIHDNKEYLSEVDGAIGDGDHGINMNKGFTICGERIAEQDCSMSEAMETLGDILMSEIGGSMGPIYGTVFMEMGETAHEEIDLANFADMMNAAYEGLAEIVDAREGDKTLMDVIIPAKDSLKKSVEENRDFAEALSECAAAAEAGRDRTKDLVAKFGRASRLGERSRGILDAGATSCALIVKSLCESLKEMLSE